MVGYLTRTLLSFVKRETLLVEKQWERKLSKALKEQPRHQLKKLISYSLWREILSDGCWFGFSSSINWKLKYKFFNPVASAGIQCAVSHPLHFFTECVPLVSELPVLCGCGVWTSNNNNSNNNCQMDSCCQITTGLWITEGCVGERKPLEVTVQLASHDSLEHQEYDTVLLWGHTGTE